MRAVHSVLAWLRRRLDVLCEQHPYFGGSSADRYRGLLENVSDVVGQWRESMPPVITECPNETLDNCNFQPRYDTTPPSLEIITMLTEAFKHNADQLFQVIEAASTTVYRGEVCTVCGLFNSAE